MRTIRKYPFIIGVTLLAAVPIVVALAILRSPSPQRALAKACMSGDLLQARLAILCGADVKNYAGASLPNLVAAGWWGNVQIIEFLLSRGADIETADKYGGTALSRAAQHGRGDAVEYLLAHGANPNVKDKEGGNTPMDLAEMNYGFRVQRINAEIEDNKGDNTLLDLAAINYDRVITALKNSGGVANAK